MGGWIILPKRLKRVGSEEGVPSPDEPGRGIAPSPENLYFFA